MLPYLCEASHAFIFQHNLQSIGDFLPQHTHGETEAAGGKATFPEPQVPSLEF